MEFEKLNFLDYQISSDVPSAFCPNLATRILIHQQLHFCKKEKFERNWSLVHEGDKTKWLLDTTSIKKDGKNQFKFISLISYKNKQFDKNIKGAFYSTQFYQRVKCDTQQSKWYIAQFYDTSMDNGVTMKGNVVDTIRPSEKVNSWRSSQIGSPNDKINRFVCLMGNKPVFN